MDCVRDSGVCLNSVPVKLCDPGPLTSVPQTPYVIQPTISQSSWEEKLRRCTQTFLLIHKELQEHKAAHYEVRLGQRPTMNKPFGSCLENMEDSKWPQILWHLSLRT